ncbi:MAG TPA: hypothetical protein ENJ51_08400 [Leucothrix mucor]|uniref:Uncharacterized protein n=1 Tax=Leucothrix mucor TaxID=45248 RepID=A0A7V2T3T8_LEUMU|nr:hypothetical protein [Leucothrix mucor]
MKNITVPINQEAMEKLNYDACEDDELIELYLDENQYKELWSSKILEAFNEKLGILHIPVDTLQLLAKLIKIQSHKIPI